MVELAQSDIAQTLPGLLDDLNTQPIVICRDGEPIGAVVSMKAFNELKKIQIDRMMEIASQAEGKLVEHAAELRISPEELVERLLTDED
jgi:hypothetical protein